MVRGMNGQAPAYPDRVRGSGGTPSGRLRPRGNIEQLASGSLRVRVYAGVDALTGRDMYVKETIPAGRDAPAQARQALDELVKQVMEGRQPKTNASVRLLIERHLEVATIERRGRESLRSYLNKHVAPLIGDRPIGSVNAQVLDCFYAELRRCRDHCDGHPTTTHHTAGKHACDRRCRQHVCTPLAAWTIRKIHYLLSAAYQTAIAWDWIAVNPTSRARKPPPPGPDPQPPTAEEAAALINESWRRGFGPFVWLAMTTGARRGELCALRWRNLQVHHTEPNDHDCVRAHCRYTLVIRRGLCQGSNGELWESDTKTHQRRHVALDPQTVAVLMEHRQHAERDAVKLGVTLTNDHFMFAGSPDGCEPYKPASISQRYRRCAKALRIDTKLKCLRHYSATQLITAGVDVRTVAGRLGHGGGGTTTLKVYAAWVAAADQHASTVLMNRMPARPGPPPDVTDRPKVEPRWPHERVAAQLHTAWRTGTLPAGSELTAKDIGQAHGVSVGTAHRVMTLLNQWGILTVRNGRRSIVNAVEPTDPGQQNPTAAGTEPATRTLREKASPHPLTLHLVHLGTSVRTMRTQADPDDVETLQKLLLDAVRRVGGDRSRIGEYELTVHLAGNPDAIATVVVAA
jgi:integrase